MLGFDYGEPPPPSPPRPATPSGTAPPAPSGTAPPYPHRTWREFMNKEEPPTWEERDLSREACGGRYATLDTAKLMRLLVDTNFDADGDLAFLDSGADDEEITMREEAVKHLVDYDACDAILRDTLYGDLETDDPDIEEAMFPKLSQGGEETEEEEAAAEEEEEAGEETEAVEETLELESGGGFVDLEQTEGVEMVAEPSVSSKAAEPTAPLPPTTGGEEPSAEPVSEEVVAEPSAESVPEEVAAEPSAESVPEEVAAEPSASSPRKTRSASKAEAAAAEPAVSKPPASSPRKTRSAATASDRSAKKSKTDVGAPMAMREITTTGGSKVRVERSIHRGQEMSLTDVEREDVVKFVQQQLAIVYNHPANHKCTTLNATFPNVPGESAAAKYLQKEIKDNKGVRGPRIKAMIMKASNFAGKVEAFYARTKAKNKVSGLVKEYWARIFREANMKRTKGKKVIGPGKGELAVLQGNLGASREATEAKESFLHKELSNDVDVEETAANFFASMELAKKL